MVWCEKKIAFICALGKFDDTRTDEEDSGKRATLFVWVFARKKTLIAWIMQTFAILWDLFTSFCLPVSYVFGYTNLRQRKSFARRMGKKIGMLFFMSGFTFMVVGIFVLFHKSNQRKPNWLAFGVLNDGWMNERAYQRACAHQRKHQS